MSDRYSVPMVDLEDDEEWVEEIVADSPMEAALEARRKLDGERTSASVSPSFFAKHNVSSWKDQLHP